MYLFSLILASFVCVVLEGDRQGFIKVQRPFNNQDWSLHGFNIPIYLTIDLYLHTYHLQFISHPLAHARTRGAITDLKFRWNHIKKGAQSKNVSNKMPLIR